jgi:hypothetical protein
MLLRQDIYWSSGVQLFGKSLCYSPEQDGMDEGKCLPYSLIALGISPLSSTSFQSAILQQASSTWRGVWFEVESSPDLPYRKGTSAPSARDSYLRIFCPSNVSSIPAQSTSSQHIISALNVV